MKKIIILLVLCITTAVSTWAQNGNKNQISVSFGAGSMPEFRDFAITLGSLTDVEFNNQSGTFSLQYLRFLNNKIGVGGILAYERQSGISNALIDKNNLKDISENNITVMPTLSGYWYRGRVFGFYSKLAAGACLVNRKGIDEDEVKKNETEFAYQAAVAGVDLGGEHLRFFAELGIGYQGIINLGINYSF